MQNPVAGKTVDVYVPPSVQAWMPKLYDCASNQAVVLRLVDSRSSAVIDFRIGEPEHLTTPAFQIDTENILIVTHRQSPIQNLTLEEARALFAGTGDPSLQVWVYAAEDDIQRVFDNYVMQGTPVTSLARLAASPQQMSDTLNDEINAVGILPQHWKVGDARYVYTIADIPVLAIVRDDPQGTEKDLITCLQK